MTFTGFPVAALDFYDDLEVENTKAFWDAHKAVYAEAVKAPMVALTDELAEEFGPAKLFRPNRDVRFSADKSPYKTHQGAYVRTVDGAGWYVQLSAAGVMVGGGFYSADPKLTAALREGIADQRRGRELERLVAALVEAGFSVGGEQLKTAPRGYEKDHPRIELLRHKSLTFRVDHGFGDLIASPELVDRIREDWRTLRPVLDWFTRQFAAATSIP